MCRFAGPGPDRSSRLDYSWVILPPFFHERKGAIAIKPPPRPPFEIAYLGDIPHTPTDASIDLRLVGEWKQLRHFFGMREFSANAFIATAPGQEIVHEHFEQPNDNTSEAGDEELYYLARGRAVAKLNGQEVELGPGALIFVGDPGVVRSVTARESGTTILAFGTNPGVKFAVSQFERQISPPPRWS